MTTQPVRLVAEQPGNVWTEERIRAYGVRMPSVDAVQAVFGCGTTRAYEALRSDEDLGLPVLKLGRCYVTPTAAVLRLLHLSEVDSGVARAV